MEKCKRCGSFAINENSHGRESGKDLHLCDVCYWRKMAEQPSNTQMHMDGLCQCPYEKATRCRMDEPCRGCETWAAHQ